MQNHALSDSRIVASSWQRSRTDVRRMEARMQRDARWKALLDLLADRGPARDRGGGRPSSTCRPPRSAATSTSSPSSSCSCAPVAARSRTASSYDLPLRYKMARHAAEKQRIGVGGGRARRAGQASSASTAAPPPPRWPAHWRCAPTSARSAARPALTVVTNALNIAHELAVRPHVKLVRHRRRRRARSRTSSSGRSPTPCSTPDHPRRRRSSASTASASSTARAAHNEGEAAVNG